MFSMSMFSLPSCVVSGQVGLLTIAAWDVLAIPLLLSIDWKKGFKDAGREAEELSSAEIEAQGIAPKAVAVSYT